MNLTNKYDVWGKLGKKEGRMKEILINREEYIMDQYLDTMKHKVVNERTCKLNNLGVWRGGKEKRKKERRKNMYKKKDRNLTDKRKNAINEIRKKKEKKKKKKKKMV